MNLNRTVTAAAVALGMCSLAYAGGPAIPKAELPNSTRMIPTPVHESCHEDLRTHGGSYPEHYHRQSDCRVIIAEGGGGYDDCHRDVLRHSLPGYGRVWHRHRGSSCRVEIYEEDSGPAPGVGGCIQVGPVTVCP